MDYSFNADVAMAYGVNEAIFIHNLYWWITKNEANGRHYRDGRTWTYNSTEALAQLFPFWTPRQIRHIINKLRDNGVIYVANYNKSGFDRTHWYALGNDVLKIYNGEKADKNVNIHLTDLSNGSDKSVTPIPDSKPDSKPVSNTYDRFFENAWQSYPRKEGKGRISKSKKQELFKLGDEFLRSIDRYKQKLKAEHTELRYIQQGSTFFNSGYVDYLDDNYTAPEVRSNSAESFRPSRS